MRFPSLILAHPEGDLESQGPGEEEENWHWENNRGLWVKFLQSDLGSDLGSITFGEVILPS